MKTIKHKTLEINLYRTLALAFHSSCERERERERERGKVHLPSPFEILNDKPPPIDQTRPLTKRRAGPFLYRNKVRNLTPYWCKTGVSPCNCRRALILRISNGYFVWLALDSTQWKYVGLVSPEPHLF